MKLGVSTCFLTELNVYDVVKTFKEAGINNAEINEEHYRDFLADINKAKEFKKFIDGEGFSVPQGHLIFGNAGDITSYDNTYAIDNLKRNLDVFEAIGVKAAVIHYSNFGTDVVPVSDWFDVRINALNQLIKHIENTDIVICLENLSRVHDHDAGHLLKMCKSVDNQNHIGICLDTGHLNISSYGNQYHFIMQAGKFLKAVHAHDNRGEQYGLKGLPCDWHIFPFGGGNVNFENVKTGLKNVNYDGLFSYELGIDAPLEVKKLQLEYMRKLYDLYFNF